MEGMLLDGDDFEIKNLMSQLIKVLDPDPKGSEAFILWISCWNTISSVLVVNLCLVVLTNIDWERAETKED